MAAGALFFVAILITIGPILEPIPSKSTADDVTAATTVNVDAETVTTTEMAETASIPLACRISLDVNPSIGLTVTNGLVTAIEAYNDDGLSISLQAEVIGQPPEEAVRRLVCALAGQGYLASADSVPQLIVTVSDGDQLASEDSARRLAEAAEETLVQLALDCEVHSAFVPDNLAAEAASLHLSAGRYLVLRAAAEAEGLSLEQAITQFGSLKINDLLQRYPAARSSFSDSQPAPSQVPAEQIQTASDLYRQETADAQKTFNLAMETLKADLKARIEALGSPGSKEERKQYKDAVKLLRAEAKETQQQAIDDMKAAFKAARQKFTASVKALGLTGEAAEDLLAGEADIDETAGGLDDYISSLTAVAGEEDAG